MSFFQFIGLMFVLTIVGFVIHQYILSSARSQLDAALQTVQDFNPTHKYFGDDGQTGLAIDADRNSICILIRFRGDVGTLLIPHTQLISSEIVENGSTVTKTSRASQAGGAIIGGLALGGVGALLGGLSGKTISTQKIKRVDLRLMIENVNYPIHEVNFMNFESDADGIGYTSSIKLAQHWHGLLSVLIRNAQGPQINATDPRMSVADEIRKLAQLRDEGVISNEDFDKQKSILLQSGLPKPG